MNLNLQGPTRNFATSKGILTYHLYQLFNEIKNRSIIWKRSGRNRKAVETAWKDITRIFVPYYEELNEKEKNAVVTYFKTTWRSCLDVMIKSYRQRALGNKEVPIYRHVRQFLFFLKSRGLKLENIASKRELQELDSMNLTRKSVAGDSAKQIDTKTISKKSDSTPKTCSRKRKTVFPESETNPLQIKKSLPTASLNDSSFDSVRYGETNNENDEDDGGNSSENNNDQVIYAEKCDFLPHQQDQNIAAKSEQFLVQPRKLVLPEDDDADQSFFDSLKPTLRKMNESQKLDFKIQVLKVLRKY